MPWRRRWVHVTLCAQAASGEGGRNGCASCHRRTARRARRAVRGRVAGVGVRAAGRHHRHPSSAASRAVVSVTTAGFPEDTPVDVRWNGSAGPVLASGQGPGFTATFTVPQTFGGVYTVVAATADEHAAHTEARAVFEVMGPPPPPPPSAATTLLRLRHRRLRRHRHRRPIRSWRPRRSIPSCPRRRCRRRQGHHRHRRCGPARRHAGSRRDPLRQGQRRRARGRR